MPADFADLPPPFDPAFGELLAVRDPTDAFVLAAFACFDLVGSAWADAVRLVPPELVRFEEADFSAAGPAEPPLAFVVLDGLLVALAVISDFEPEFPLVDVAIMI